jgi:guanylate kinase
MSGSLFIVSAPSGAGKTTILKEAMQRAERLVFSVSHTTRTARAGEQHGQDYYFVEQNAFEEMIGSGAFLEWARVHGNYYGTAMAQLTEKLDRGYDVVLDIDVQGAEIIRNEGQMTAADIFIAPPDRFQLEERLRKRGTEDEQSIRTRLANAEAEMDQCEKYDYLIVNDTIEDAVTMLCSIIYAGRARDRRTKDGRLIPAMSK